MISSTFNSKMDLFLNDENINKAIVLKKIGAVGVGSIKANTPEDTGVLRGDTRFVIDGNEVVFINNIEYAASVELGTSRQAAQPFMRLGIAKSIRAFYKILQKELGV